MQHLLTFAFQNDSLKTEDGSVSNAAPDICIAYKLHLECGRLINLYDWLEVSLYIQCYYYTLVPPFNFTLQMFGFRTLLLLLY